MFLSHCSVGRVYSLCLLAVVWSLVSCPIARGAELRVWTSADGLHTTIAELVRVEDDIAVLKKANGDLVRVPVTRLSKSDRAYLRGSRIADDDTSESVPSDTKRRSDLTTAEAVEREAAQARTAADALLVYEFALALDALPTSERRKVEDRMQHWIDLADKGMVRLGNRWVPEEEAERATEDAKKKIELAIEMLYLGNGPLAAQALEEASEADPNSTEADFITGVLYGLLNRDDRSAVKSFEECLRRDPGNVAALNNLAVSQAFMRRFEDAVENWSMAASYSPEAEVLADNLGCLLALSTHRNVRVPKKALIHAAEVYGELIREHEHERPDTLRLRYMLPARFKAGKKSRDSEGELVTVSSGSGFVVAPNVILTNKHVTEGAETFLIVNPEDHSDKLAATLIAESPDEDLALIRCEQLDATPVPLSLKVPRRGEDIMVLGYPLGPEFGMNIKSTRGGIVAIPPGSKDEMIVYDAITNPGNSGGPLVDQEGRVVGVVRAIMGSIGGVYGHAIAMENAKPFLDRHLSGIGYVNSPASAIGWPEVDARIAPSTVLILNRQRLLKEKGLERGASR